MADAEGGGAVSSGCRTVDHCGSLPACWVKGWRAQYLKQQRGTGSILDLGAGSLTAEQRRTLRFGPVWRWWGLSESERAWWWEQDGK